MQQRYGKMDEVLEKLIRDYGNAAFDCGDWRDPYEDDRCFIRDSDTQHYKEVYAVYCKAKQALFDGINAAIEGAARGQ